MKMWRVYNNNNDGGQLTNFDQKFFLVPLSLWLRWATCKNACISGPAFTYMYKCFTSPHINESEINNSFDYP